MRALYVLTLPLLAISARADSLLSISYNSTLTGGHYAGTDGGNSPNLASYLVPGFDPSLGTLRDVLVQVTFTINPVIVLYSTAKDAAVLGDYSAAASVDGPFTAVQGDPDSNDWPESSSMGSHIESDFDVPVAGIASYYAPNAEFPPYNTDGLVYTAAQSQSILEPSLSPFILNGDLGFEANYNDSWSSTNSNVGDEDWLTTVTLQQTTTYFYLPTPEPSTLGLLATVGLALLLLRAQALRQRSRR